MCSTNIVIRLLIIWHIKVLKSEKLVLNIGKLEIGMGSSDKNNDIYVLTNEEEEIDGNEDESGDSLSFNPTDLKNSNLKKLIGITSNKNENGKKEALKDHQLTRLSPIESKLQKEQKPNSGGGIIDADIASQQGNKNTGDGILTWMNILEKPKDIKNIPLHTEKSITSSSNKLMVLDKTNKNNVDNSCPSLMSVHTLPPCSRVLVQPGIGQTRPSPGQCSRSCTDT